MSGRIKGSTLAVITEVLRSIHLRSKEVPDHLHRYFDDPIAPSGWYPEEHWFELIRVLARRIRKNYEGAVWQIIGRWFAQYDMGLQLLGEGIPGSGFFSRLDLKPPRTWLKKDDPIGTMRLGDELWKLCHDSGERITEIKGPNEVLVRIDDYVPPADQFCWMMVGYIGETLIIANALNVRVAHTACRLEEEQSCSWVCTWEHSLQNDPLDASEPQGASPQPKKCAACGWINEGPSTSCSRCKKPLR